MTFVLNILHKDFSLLAADRKARINGPATITMGGLNIQVQGKITIQGFQKLYLSANKSLALGIAGDVQDHAYVAALDQTGSIRETLALVHKHMGDFLSIDETVVSRESFMQNEVIATFFDPVQHTYFSNISLFTPVSNTTRLYTRSIENPLLIHIGSGSTVFERAVGKDEILQFASSVRSIDKLDDYLKWLKAAYEKVSIIDEGSGDEFAAVLSTKETPIFQPVKP